MDKQVLSIKPFIGARDFKESRAFYKEVGFEEVITSETMSYFKIGKFGFYLQDAYVKDWVDNSMLFLEVKDVDSFREAVLDKNLTDRFLTVRISKIHYNGWGDEFFVHDPSGILWHIGKFK
ncbi:glyoxalase/bleomycin resistance protein/dioxygenase [Nonlabens dokdonensis DSW-6]|uniref:Glyoxalase/bleomycin resistance protein/dioxygenase n=2 Tax=Nonlabens dokdonensis TaxID=328515 RepID=L7W8Z6_NONDD|nr:glyoxalase/bleomycin resistance protein/dioxygenase [Nonlabens dokdonensis]AGC76639.1 glyoxalase/bleomycin resistance protein/dioxygenase [Nonlabens dokdonensis DSW-6]